MRTLTCTSHYPLPDGRLEILAGHDDVVPSMSLLETGGAKLLIDCGATHDPGFLENLDMARQVDAVILTHAHFDHLGSLPDLLSTDFNAPVIATPATLEIGKILLEDSLCLQGVRSDQVVRILRKLDSLAQPQRYDSPLSNLPGFRGQIILREAGHILGSASIEIVSPESRVIFSGDLGRPGSPLLRDYYTGWDADRPVDLVVMESTYGARPHTYSSEEICDQLESIVKRALKDGGHILVPCFAIGRVQALLYYLNDLIESGRLEQLPVAVDTPMGIKVTETYDRYRKLYDRESLVRIAFGDEPLSFHDLFAVYKSRHSVQLRDLKRPMFIVAGSGMCTGGRIIGHLKQLLPFAETNIIFVGYQARGTPGRQIQKLGESNRDGPTPHILLDGESIPVRAAVDTLHGLSAHAGQRELGRWLDYIPKVKTVLLNHGEPESQTAFVQWYTK